MAISRVQSTSSTLGGATSTYTFSSAPTSGNLLVIACYGNNTGSPTTYGWTSSAGWTLLEGHNDTYWADGAIFYKISDGTETSATFGQTGATSTHIVAAEYSGIDTSSPVDSSAGQTALVAANKTATSGTLATSNADVLLFMAVAIPGSASAPVWGSSFTSQTYTTRVLTGDRIVSSTGSYSGTVSWTAGGNTSNSWMIIAFKAASAGTTGQAKVYNGSSFVAKPVKVYNGSTWDVKPMKVYNGSTWVETNY